MTKDNGGMKQKIPTSVVVAAIVVLVVGVLYFGWRTIKGGPDADVTEASIKHWQAAKTQAMAHKPTSAAEAQQSGAPITVLPGGAASRGNAPAGAPMGAPSGGGMR